MTHKSFFVVPPSLALLSVLLFFAAIFTKKTIVPCANTVSCEASFNLDIENNTLGTFQNQSVIAPPVIVSPQSETGQVFGIATSSAEKHIFVNLTQQTLYAYEGDSLFLQTLISSGKWYPTPTGEFTVWTKVRATRMTGGSGADYYDLPNVPYVMFFANDKITRDRGFGLHGAYWHNNFGHPMSHGCINLRHVDAEKLYSWADISTKITIEN